MLGLNSIRSGGAANDDVDAIDLVQASGSDIAGDNIDDPAAFDRDDDGGGNSAVGIGDAIAAVTWIGTSSGGPPNGNGRQYNIDNNANGISDAPSTTDAEHDRRQPRRRSAPNGAESIADALLVVKSIGDHC